MSIYFSASTLSFFNDDLHGPRTVIQIDEDAQQKLSADIETRAEALIKECEAEGVEPDAAVLLALHEERMALLANPPKRLIDNPLCTIPDDAVEVTNAEHGAAITGQMDGMEIYADSDGRPALRKRQLPADEILASARRMRDKALTASDWTQLSDATLSAAKKKAWKEHRQRLRDLPSEVEKALADGTDVDLDTLMPVKP